MSVVGEDLYINYCSREKTRRSAPTIDRMTTIRPALPCAPGVRPRFSGI